MILLFVGHWCVYIWCNEFLRQDGKWHSCHGYPEASPTHYHHSRRVSHVLSFNINVKKNMLEGYGWGGVRFRPGVKVSVRVSIVALGLRLHHDNGN